MSIVTCECTKKRFCQSASMLAGFGVSWLSQVLRTPNGAFLSLRITVRNDQCARISVLIFKFDIADQTGNFAQYLYNGDSVPAICRSQPLDQW